MSDDVTPPRLGRRILVVDDEPDVRMTLCMLLELEQYDVLTAPDGRAALQAAHKGRPDLVITDFMMPWMNGRELTVELRNNEVTRSIPVVLMSGVDPGEPRPWDATLRKPMEITELLQTVEQLLKSGPQRQASR